MLRRKDFAVCGDLGGRPFQQAHPVANAENADYLLVQKALPDRAFFQRFQQRRPVETFLPARHGFVQSGRYGLFGGTGLQPVGDDKALEAPLVLENVRQHLPAVAHKLEIDAVGRCHDAPGMSLLHRRLVNREVNLVQRAFIDNGIVEVPVGLPVIAGIMLEAGGNAQALKALHHRDRHGTVQIRVFRVILEKSSSQRIPQDIDAGAQQDRLAHGPKFLCHHLPRPEHQLRIPGR